MRDIEKNSANRAASAIKSGCNRVRKRQSPTRCIASQNGISQKERICVATFSNSRVYIGRTLQYGREVTMPALAEILSTRPSRLPPRMADRPICAICADSIVAAEASAFLSDDVISYLWTCDNCGYGFVTKHSTRIIACN
jgi:hypothetical protein